MVTVSGNPNPTYPSNPTNPTTKYHCEFVNLNCIYTFSSIRIPQPLSYIIIIISDYSPDHE